MSIFKSTLSMLTFICVCAVIIFASMGIEIDEFSKQILAGIVGAYLGSRTPGAKDIPGKRFTPKPIEPKEVSLTV